jgi:predicted outer membrane repeat protein
MNVKSNKTTLLMVLTLLFCLMAVGTVNAADTPSANFTSNVTNGTAPLSVQFNDTSKENPTSWNWDFGDNTTSTEQNPTHIYNNEGTYNVSLTVANEIGNNTTTKNNYITVILSDIYVSPNGDDTTGDGTISNPYSTIQKALTNVDDGGTIHLASGTYTGTGNYGLTLSKNVVIVGEDQTSTIINAAGLSNIFTINSGIIVSLTNLTFANGTATNGGTIFNKGTLNVSNCTFTGNTVTTYGGALYNNKGALNVSNCTFTNNAATTGAAIYSNNGISCIVIGSTFTSNKAVKGGGAISSNGNNSNTTVNFCSFVNNTATTGSAIYSVSGTINAEYNWWGSNSDPSSQIYSGGTINYTNWLYMTLTTNSTTIANGSTCTVTVSFNNIYNGTTVTSIDSTNGTILNGNVVTFSSTYGSFDPITTITVNGTATTTLTANDTRIINVNAKTDNQTLSTYLNGIFSIISVNNVTGIIDSTLNLTANLTDCDGNALPSKTVTFTVDGNSYNVKTDNNGIATLNYQVNEDGIYTVTASFAGDDYYFECTNNGENYLAVQSNDVYVSPTGNDTTGNGTATNPFATIGYGLKCVADEGTLHLAAGNYTGTGNYGITISNNVTIVGDGQSSTIITATSSGNIFTINMDGNGFRIATLTGTNASNIFTINPGITVTISNLTLQNGTAVQGGAIYNSGTLNIADCTLTGNSVYQSDIYATYQSTYLYTFYKGGAIYNSGTLSITGCTFTDNCASYQGGAIYNYGTVTSVNGCSFMNNTVVCGNGGTICNFGTITSVNGCNFMNNTAQEGGAICNGPVTNGFGIYSTLNFTNCTFIGNTAATGWGGAILNGDAATLSLSNCSFVNNTATTGGAIYSWGPLTVNACTFSNNTAESSGAIFNRDDATSTDCTFINNTATRYSGGGIGNSGNLNIISCVFVNNSAIAGGAISNRPDGTIGILSNCTFINNTATTTGGAIDSSNTITSLIYCAFENNIANNTSNNIYISDGSVNELVASNLEIPENPVNGTTYTINTTVTNTGVNDGGSFVVKLYDNNVQVGKIVVNELAAGASTILNFNWTPNTIGNHVLSVIADTNKQINETNRTNNQITQIVTTSAASLPELATSNLEIPTDTINGTTYTINVTIGNIGNADAGTFTVKLYDNNTQIGKIVVNGLAAGTSTTLTFNWTPTTVGNHVLSVIADVNKQINETNRTNNQITQNINTKASTLPDLTATNLELPETPVVGTTYTINVTISNTGTSDATSFAVKLYDNNTQIQKITVNSLAAGESTVLTFNWTPTTNGTHKLSVIGDANKQLTETIETNNQITETITAT